MHLAPEGLFYCFFSRDHAASFSKPSNPCSYEFDPFVLGTHLQKEKNSHGLSVLRYSTRETSIQDRAIHGAFLGIHF